KPAKAAPEKRRLTFKERKEYESLDAEIPQLEAEKAQLEASMSSGQLSTEELIKAGERMTQLIDELDEKSMRWLELSEWI
ncbi:MAG: ABC transporter C-terminal domain-containing protein, partial [Parabacteroides sp.]|nr:ABC transporter C-terminal domain-containing protein [Parabacteroides sp.]